MRRQLNHREPGCREAWLFLDKTPLRKHSKSMKPTKERSNAILWIEGFGFSILIAFSWLTEVARIPHFLFEEPFTPNWHRAILRTIVITLIWTWVHLATRRLLKRLHHLEEFLRICSWCRKVCHDGDWLTLEEYFNSKFATQTSHGMCPECLKKSVQELKKGEKEAVKKAAGVE
jgi:hypothetical protein